MSAEQAAAVRALAATASEIADQITMLAQTIDDFSTQCQIAAPDLQIEMNTGAARDAVNQALSPMMAASNQLTGYAEALES